MSLVIMLLYRFISYSYICSKLKAMNYSRIYNAYIYVYILHVYFVLWLFILLHYIFILSTFVSKILERREFDKLSDSAFPVRNLLIILLRNRVIPVPDAINRSVEKVCLVHIHRDIFNLIYLLAWRKPGRHYIREQDAFRYTHHALRGSRSARADASGCGALRVAPHLGARVGYTGASPEMDGKTRQFREIIFALRVWNATLRFATWFMCGVDFMVGCNKHVVEINNGSSGWV